MKRNKTTELDTDLAAALESDLLNRYGPMLTGEALPSEDREKTFGAMVAIALEAAFS